MDRQGSRLRAAVLDVIAAHGLGEFVTLTGRPCNMVYGTRDAAGVPSQPFRTLFLQELLRNGVIAPSFVVSSAHTDDDVDRTVAAVDAALDVYAKAIAAGSVEGLLHSRPVKPTFRPYS